MPNNFELLRIQAHLFLSMTLDWRTCILLRAKRLMTQCAVWGLSWEIGRSNFCTLTSLVKFKRLQTRTAISREIFIFLFKIYTAVKCLYREGNVRKTFMCGHLYLHWGIGKRCKITVPRDIVDWLSYWRQMWLLWVYRS